MGMIYESTITENDKTVHEKYVSIVMEYLTNICYKKLSPFIIIRGLDTITHVFIMLLYYTQHLETTYLYTQKGLYLYIEFIEQIAFDANSFLQLNSKDAVIYVYKKTLYEMKPVHCKKNENVERHKKICLFIDQCKMVVTVTIQKDGLGPDVDLEKVRDSLALALPKGQL